MHPNSLANLQRGRAQPNKRTLSGADRAAKLTPADWKRLKTLIVDPETPGAVAVAACKLILAYAHGRPPLGDAGYARPRPEAGAILDMLEETGEEWAAEVQAARAEREALANGGGGG